MFFNVNSVSRGGLRHNEDAVYASEGLLIVMDGASSLSGVHLTTAPTDACWLAGATVELLRKKLSDEHKPISIALDEAAAELRQSLRACGYPEHAESYPSGSLMVARLVGEELELFSLGDCTALVRFYDERPVLCIHDDAVTRLDRSVLTRAKALAMENGVSVAQVLPELQSMLVENRMKRNQENGYWIFDPSGEGIAHGWHMQLPSAEVHSLALMSDGFYDITQIGGVANHQQLMALLETTPAETLVDGLFATLEADWLLDRFPRFKLKDDATVAYACVE